MSSFSLISASEKQRIEALYSNTGSFSPFSTASLDADAVQLVTFVRSEAIDLEFNYFKPEWAGRKLGLLLAGSAIAAGGRLADVKLTLSLPSSASVEFLTALMDGFKDVLPEDVLLSVQLRPGAAVLTASMAALIVPVDRFLQIQQPEPGDVICVTGELGSAMAGLSMLRRFVKPDVSQEEIQANLAEHEESVKSYLYPELLVDFREELAGSGIELSSCRIISENALEAFRQLVHSRVDLVVDCGTFPIRNHTYRAAALEQADAFEWALKGGEDAEFVFTLTQEQVPLLQEVFPLFRVVGAVTDGTGKFTLIDKNGVSNSLMA